MKKLEYLHLGKIKTISKRYIIKEGEQVMLVHEFFEGGKSVEWIDEEVAERIKPI